MQRRLTTISGRISELMNEWAEVVDRIEKAVAQGASRDEVVANEKDLARIERELSQSYSMSTVRRLREASGTA